MPVDEPVAFPNLKARTKMRENVHLVCCFDRQIVVIDLDMMRNADIVAVIKEQDVIERHSAAYAKSEGCALIYVNGSA